MTRRISSSLDRDQLVQRIYDTADEPEGVAGVLAELSAHAGAPYGQSLVIAGGTELVEHGFTGADESEFASYFDWRDQDPRFFAAHERPGVLLSDTIDIDRRAFERSAIFNDYLLRSDSYYTTFGAFPLADGLVLAQAFIRGRRLGPFSPAEIAAVMSLIPHLRRAVQLRHLVRSMREELVDLRRALDFLPAASAVLDSTGKVVCANTRAEALFRERNGVHTAHGKLTASRLSDARALAGAIAQTAIHSNASSGAAPIVPPISIARLGKEPIAVVLFALRPQSALRDTSRAVRVIALFHDPEQHVRLKPNTVASVYGLTATEALLACAIAEGHTLANFASKRGCSEDTARTHLKRILEKTGTSRQADLVRVLLTGVAMRGLE
ncbi:MAG: hypothetical protein KF795_10545 [Labilithrix sp.]|nr:hypothetical protein [Labilithrix sp.]